MDMISTLSRIASGFAVKLAVVGFAAWGVVEVYSFVSTALAPIAGVMR